ncbi:MAG: MBL fold metallo-hydrolase [bacterium]|nr:MBL fold metallo-hydrolase [bacterium]
MEKIILLGSAGAVTNGDRDNVSLALSIQPKERADYQLLIECGGSAAHKLAKLGIPYESLEDIILTHAHLDHIYGLPGLVFSMIYRDLSRKKPLRIYCPEEAVETIRTLLDFFGLRRERSFPVEIKGIPAEEHSPVFDNEHILVTASPVDHAPGVATFGLRIENKLSGKVVVYSGDTGYSERLIRLAENADMLFHECSGLSQQPIPSSHSNALEVGQVALQCKAKKLVLLHFDCVLNDEVASMIREVRQSFTGEIVAASDFDEYII